MTTLTDLLPACDRLDAAIAADLVTRKTWTREEGGRHLVCLLVALVPYCGEQKEASACPATVMPRWLAELTPLLDDVGSAEAWPAMIREFARLLRASHGMSAEDWYRLEFQFRAICVREARSHVPPESAVSPTVDLVIGMLDRAGLGSRFGADSWEEVGAEAEEAWDAAEKRWEVAVARTWASSPERTSAQAEAQAAWAEVWATRPTDDAAAQTAMAAAWAEEWAMDRITAKFFEAWGRTT